jgi:hypothetical protein
MAVEVITRSRRRVQPDNPVAWYENIRAVERRTPRPAGLGARIAFVATFLGRRFVCTYEGQGDRGGAADS